MCMSVILITHTHRHTVRVCRVIIGLADFVAAGMERKNHGT